MISIIQTIISGVTVAIIAALYRDNCKLRKKRKEENLEKEQGISEGVLCLLRVQLIEYHDKYTEKGYIPSYAYGNWYMMYRAYKALGGNGMVDHMKDDIDELEFIKKNQKTMEEN